MSRKIRVIVVIDLRRDTIHGITTDNDKAVGWITDLKLRYGSDPPPARIYIGYLAADTIAAHLGTKP